MIGLPDPYGRVHESWFRFARFAVPPARGFGLYLFIERQPRTRGVS